ncbi:hypothetical protein [Nonomuraea pusilla]|uniref:Uncharacterized protein n=1 Tax=Nonomuraea pusilla TaxID=46177 RepID=A0A1H7SJZ3_9ACTN|nr:hypothetical protein [Nonomuraea pusilla]SEL72825.1 hypothetical protein SAMN05660976_03236 [Nonomuraea pusilla]
MGAARGVPRWLLLALLVLLVTGVWGMHTLGHAGSHARAHAGSHDGPSTAAPAHAGLSSRTGGAPGTPPAAALPRTTTIPGTSFRTTPEPAALSTSLQGTPVRTAWSAYLQAAPTPAALNAPLHGTPAHTARSGSLGGTPVPAALSAPLQGTPEPATLSTSLQGTPVRAVLSVFFPGMPVQGVLVEAGAAALRTGRAVAAVTMGTIETGTVGMAGGEMGTVEVAGGEVGAAGAVGEGRSGEVAAGGFRGEWRSGHRLPDLDPAAVCLAVLTSLLLPLLAAAYVRGRLDAATAAGTRPSGGPVARPPPRGMGIRLTRVSVLRI